MSQMSQYASLNAAVEKLTGDTGVVAYPIGGNIDILGGTNINTVGTVNAITVNLEDSISLTGTIDAVGDITSSAGDIEATLGNFLAPVGSITVALDVTSSTGDLVATLGNVAAAVGNVSAGGNVTAGADVSAGDEVLAVNNITTSAGDIVSTLGAGSFATSVTVGNDLHVLAGGADIVGTVEFSDLVAGTMRTDASGVISSLADGADGMVLISSTAGTPIWATLTPGANIGILEAANSITISVTGVVTSLTGGTNINLTGTATDSVVNLDDTITLSTVNATTFDTNVATAGLTISGTSLTADGTDVDIDIYISPKGAGVLATTELTLTTDLEIQYGGTGVSTLTQYGVLIGNAATDIQALAVGVTNQVLLGNTGANPSWGAVDLTTDITGVLPIANGGTNANTMATTYGVNYFDGTSIVTSAVGTAAQVLTSNGVGVAPTFQAASGGASTFHTDGADATEAAGAITIAGTANEIETSGAGSTVTVGLPNDVTISGTFTGVNFNATNLNVLDYAGANYLHSTGGASNVFLGTGAGLSNSGSCNTVMGYGARANATGSDYCAVFGYQASSTAAASDRMTAFGYKAAYAAGTGNAAFGCEVLSRLSSTGYRNLAIGAYYSSGTTQPAGYNYTGSESDNIVIGNPGVTSDSHTIRIGIQGGGSISQNKAFMAGIYNTTPAGGSDNVVIIDSNGQLGAQTSLDVANGGTGAGTLTDHGLLLGSGAGAITALAEATDGQIPIGSTGNDCVLATITEGTNIDVTNAAGSVTIETTKTELNTQTGTTYTLVLGDRGKTITLDNAASITLTVPPNASVALPVGTVISLAQLGAGQVSVAEGAAVTIRSIDSDKKLSAQYAMAALTKILSDTWLLAGSLSA